MSGQRRRKQQSEERFVLVPRNLRDPKLYDPDESNFVLVPESQVGSAAEHASYVAENRLRDNFTRPDAKAAMAAAQAAMEAAGGEGRASARIQLREVTEMGFKNDGYDYSQHLRPTGTGGGIFISATGKRGADPFHTYESAEEQQRQLREALAESQPARLLSKDGFMGIDNVTLNPETLPEEIKRGLESDEEDEYEPSERHTVMERALRVRREREEAKAAEARATEAAAAATAVDGDEEGAGEEVGGAAEEEEWVLAGESVGGMELLQDDFIMQALRAEEEEEEEGAAGGGGVVEFDFEAHVARLMAEAEAEEAAGAKVGLHRVGARFDHDDVDDGEEDEEGETTASSQLPAGLNPNSTLAAMLAQYDDEHIGAGSAAAGFMGGDGGGEEAEGGFDGGFDGGEGGGGGDAEELDAAAAAALFGGGGDIGAVLAALADEELRAAGGQGEEEGEGDDEEQVLVVDGANGGADMALLAAAGLEHLGSSQTRPPEEGVACVGNGAEGEDRSLRAGAAAGATTESAAMQEAMEVFLRTRGLDGSGKAVSGGELSRLDDDGEGLGGFGRFKEDLEELAAARAAAGVGDRSQGSVKAGADMPVAAAVDGAEATAVAQAAGAESAASAAAADEAAGKAAEARIDDMLRREKLADMDCQTVVSTYSTTDNLPTVLGEEGGRRRRRRRREAEAAMPAVAEANDGDEEEEEDAAALGRGLIRSKAETKAEKQERKRLAKQAKRRAREAKRQTKEQFKAAKSTLMADAARQAATGSMAKRGQSVFRYS